MNKNAYIIAAVLVGAVIVVGFVFLGGQKESYAPETSPGEQQPASKKVVKIGIKEETGAATEAGDEAEGGVTTVSYTDDGFVPDTVTINVGETVEWVNESSKDMWVASAVHPVHDVYQGTSLSEHCPNTDNTAFDSCKTGDTYSFTFQKAGSWRYHNHVGAADTGTVIVE